MGGTPKLALALCALLYLCACWYADDCSDLAPLRPACEPAAGSTLEKSAGAPAPEPREGLVGNWRQSRPGDWVQFLNTHGGLVILAVLSVDPTGVDLQVRNCSIDGVPESSDTRRVDTTEYFVPRRVERFSPVAVKFELPSGAAALDCERYIHAAQGGDEIAETLMCSAVRAGGIVFMRRGITTYYVLLDFGGADRKPRARWDTKFIDELRTKYDRPFGEKVPLEEDPPEGEPPEPPED